jgi:hypothetical protein
MIDEILSALKRYLGIDETDTSADDVLKDIINYAEGYIFSFYGVAIFDRELTESITPNYGYAAIYTANGNIREVVSFETNDQVIQPTLLSWKNNKVLIKDPTIMLVSVYPVNITYKVGYESIDDIPKGLLNSLLVISKKIWSDATKDTDTMAAMAIDIKESVR